jgi:hypothetical protein
MTEDRHKEVSDDHPENAISAYGTARSTVEGAPLSSDELRKTDAYWRASLYLCLGMLYLKENPLLREPLKPEHTKPRLLGHWGSDAGQSFTYLHFNRLINKYDLNAIIISGPGHGAPAVLSQAYLEGTYSVIYPDKTEDVTGMQRFFKQFSFPGGIGSHATPETPGSIHEGGELPRRGPHQQRPGCRTRCGYGELRRRTDDGIPGRYRAASPAPGAPQGVACNALGSWRALLATPKGAASNSPPSGSGHQPNQLPSKMHRPIESFSTNQREAKVWSPHPLS